MNSLNTKVTGLPLIGPHFEKRLENLGILTIRDLLWHAPSRYEDFSLRVKANSLQEGETVTVSGKLLEIKSIYTKNGFNLQNAKLEDDTGIVEAVWFNQRFLTTAIHKGDLVNFSGKVKRSGSKLQLENPSFEIVYSEAIHTARLVPVYPETKGITSKWLRGRINYTLKNIQISDYFTTDQLKLMDLDDLNHALKNLHFPDTLENAALAKKRLAFDELLISELETKLRKKSREEKYTAPSFGYIDTKPLTTLLPFTLTNSQYRVFKEISADLKKTIPMNRLLQGDVGSGKTIIAALAIFQAVKNGFHSAFMAPTEILANQHYKTLQKIFSPLNISVGLITKNTKQDPSADILVGTHALLSGSLKISNLGLIVIDESHRFGVGQRASLAGKGQYPHVLTMTATPIPRTVALTLYGDLDISIIDELPADRKPITTWVVPEEKRTGAYEWIRKQNSQCFVVCPLIDESESETMLEIKAAKKEFENLTKVFPALRLGLLHGKMKSSEKEKTIMLFSENKLDILVATPVIEVGIDIPKATIMIIEAADRFGLAQLHQLRGRVGRGDQKSYCLLFSENKSSLSRLKYMETLRSGLELAEIDLKFRGPGQRFGTMQHGRTGFKIADFSDLTLIEQASKKANEILKNPSAFPHLLNLIRESKIQVVQN